MTTGVEIDAASFRDPGGFVYRRDGRLLRQVNPAHARHFDRLMGSGLYAELVDAGVLIPHAEAPLADAAAPGAYKVLRPEPVTFVSYPYEWSFSQLKDAALLTLDAQRRALACGMQLKDASAYNVQYRAGRPVFIDTLSFEARDGQSPWPAYRQFCQHFLAPLLLMRSRDARLGQLSRVHLDGVPLDLASRLLPIRTWLAPGAAVHVHAHARLQRRVEGASREAAKVSDAGLAGLVDHLAAVVRGLVWRPGRSEWSDYDDDGTYDAAALAAKHALLGDFVRSVAPPVRTAWDLGANRGRFSRVVADAGVSVVAADRDPAVVEHHYRECRARSEERVLPLVVDLANPSPDQGWSGTERAAFLRRGRPDLVVALALVHHLALTERLPLARIADLFADLAPWSVVEFPGRDDARVRGLLARAPGATGGYDEALFRAAFARRFDVVRAARIGGSARTLFLMRVRR